jgi:hypothetical protein
MKSPHPSTYSSTSPSFALISVLALVSLAALTATAFLASARLERQATMPLTQTTMLDMALDSGSVAALRLLEYGAGEQFNHVVTYWRGSGANDWTNELGYLLIGSVQSNDIAANPLKVKYYFCFSSAALTNLATNLIEYTNHQSAGDQSRFTRQIKQVLEPASTRTGTNFTAGQSTNIPLLGDTPANRFTSPPVGWVYINQDVRVKPGQTNTTNVPVTRFAFYVQDLSSMIDAERMGGFTNGTPFRESTALPANYAQGTNPAEISLTNLTGTALTNSTTAANFTSTNNRAKYLSPGMLVLSNAGKLNTNDLRYITTGLRHWTNAFERIPFGLGYSNCGTSDKGTNKYCLEPVSSLTVANIRNHITSNCPPFTNNGTTGRAGGMDGGAYVTALAANIIDYADADSTATSTTTNGVNIVGFDSYPMLTHLYDQFTYSAASRTITHTTWMQFWNPSTKPTLAGNVTLNFTNNDTVRYTNSATPAVVVTPRLYASPGGTTTNFAIPSISANAGYVTNFIRNPAVSLADARFPLFPAVGPPTIHINSQALSIAALPCDNSFSYTFAGTTIAPAMTLKRQLDTLSDGVANYSAGFLAGNQYIAAAAVAGTPLPIHDPRMTPYLGQGTGNQYAQSAYNTTYWRGYVSQSGLSANMGLADPAFWPDGSSRIVSTHGILGAATAPTTGLFTNSNSTSGLDPIPCKISNSGSYTNITELGDVFDPIQWAPPVTTMSDYANCNIPAGTTWTPNNLYGGGSTLRIGRPEHQKFAWTKPSGANASDPSIPNMQMSAAALLDLFCLSNQFDEGGKINLNTAPAPVLRALAGGIYLRSDPALLPGGTNFSVPPAMAEAFAQGVMRFRARYPFYSPSQLAFIGTDPGWPNTNSWPSGAVFGNKDSIFLNSSAPGNSSGANATMGVSGWNDQAAEEWFAKIFKLSTVYSRNFRVYVIAQKATNQAGTRIGVGPVVRKYYNVLIRQNGEGAGDAPGASPVTTFQSYY